MQRIGIKNIQGLIYLQASNISKREYGRKDKIIALLKQIYTIEANEAPLHQLLQHYSHNKDIKRGSTTKGNYTTGEASHLNEDPQRKGITQLKKLHILMKKFLKY